MSKHRAGKDHEALRLELCDILKRYELKGVDKIELLAIAAGLVGQFMAMMDQRLYTSADLIELVGKNIEEGNQHVVGKLRDEAVGRA